MQNEIGDDSVVIGNIENKNVGNRSVVIGSTDPNGNTVINTPVTIGYQAKGSLNSITIGAYAESDVKHSKGDKFNGIQIKDSNIHLNLNNKNSLL